MLSLIAAALLSGSEGQAPSPVLHVSVTNPLTIARPSETVEISAAQLAPLGNDLTRIHVYDGPREVLAQALDLDGDGRHESLIFQTDVPANGQKSFELRAGDRRTYRKEDFRVYGRFVRERFDDFAWENDRVAHRMYGAALETWQREPLTSSTVDVWLKRTRRLVINDWYMVDDYHRDLGEGADFYSAGRSRGCGGSGLWREGKLVVSRNFRNSRVLANGPIRLVFELDYPEFETKRVTLDAGQNFNRFESRYTSNAAVPAAVPPASGRQDAGATAGETPALLYAAGLKKEPAAKIRTERAGGWMRTWGPVKDNMGEFGCAVVLAPANVVEMVEAEGNQLVVARAPAVYYVGSAWDRSGDFRGVEDFDRYIEQWAQRIRSPLRVEVGAR